VSWLISFSTFPAAPVIQGPARSDNIRLSHFPVEGGLEPPKAAPLFRVNQPDHPLGIQSELNAEMATQSLFKAAFCVATS
jgi:hypothetical protein